LIRRKIYHTIAVALNLSMQGNLDARTVVQPPGAQEMLIILDNIEHLLPAALEKVHALLAAAPRVVLLLTSTVRIHSTREYVFPVLGLDHARLETGGLETRSLETRQTSGAGNAVNLFVHCAIQNGAGVQQADLPWVQQICKLLEGNPLAIMMAASLTRLLSCAEVAEGIEKGVDLLAATRSELPERQKNMHSLYDYSWNQLTEKERSQVRRLSVFRAFRLEGAGRGRGFRRDLANLIDDLLLKQAGRCRF
jgi:non-specific serine/threonine protein kinase